MRVLHKTCAGLDVHKDTGVACVRIGKGKEPRCEVRTFSTTTSGLLALRDWLVERGVRHAAMEATGVYWKPVWHILQSELQLVLANAAHIQQVPGRKTDVNDATWIADLLAHGLIRDSFVPPPEIAALRDVTRTRRQCVAARSQEVLRLQKVLTDANIRIDSVLSDILGHSGRAMLQALRAGETDPVVLAGLADPRVRASQETLAEALRGTLTDHHRFMLGFHLDRIDSHNAAIETLEQEVERLLQPFRTAVELIRTVPGIKDAAASIVAEIGTDMTRFPSAAHLLSWACLCPRNDESAGKRRSTRIRKGSHWLKPVLIQAAWCAVRVKDSYERALFGRIKARRGPKKAIVAVAASMLTAIYHILRKKEPYQRLPVAHFDQIDREGTKRRLVKRLQNLGYQVELTQAA